MCRAHPARRILFSSFDPDAALIMRALQGLYPVMMISDCHPHHPDPRRRSVAAAKRCALDGGVGLVLNVKVLADGPEVADDVRASGLLLGTYGEENDDKPLATKQVEGNVPVCTDNVAALAGMFNAPAVDGGAPAPAPRRCFRRRWRRRRRRARWADGARRRAPRALVQAGGREER